jgi:hypothetical protein
MLGDLKHFHVSGDCEVLRCLFWVRDMLLVLKVQPGAKQKLVSFIAANGHS